VLLLRVEDGGETSVGAEASRGGAGGASWRASACAGSCGWGQAGETGQSSGWAGVRWLGPAGVRGGRGEERAGRAGAGPGAMLASVGGRPAAGERRLGAWAGVEQLRKGGRRVLACSGSVAAWSWRKWR
jgi:hypothetical protein